jgi:hypothetical protein
MSSQPFTTCVGGRANRSGARPQARTRQSRMTNERAGAVLHPLRLPPDLDRVGPTAPRGGSLPIVGMAFARETHRARDREEVQHRLGRGLTGHVRKSELKSQLIQGTLIRS